MLLPDLCLLPHEAGDLALGERLCAPAEARVEIEGHRAGSYLMRVVQCITTKDQVIIRRESPTNSPLLRLSDLMDISDKDEITESIRYGEFARKLFFDAEARLVKNSDDWKIMLVFDTAGRSYWQSRNGQQEELWLSIDEHGGDRTEWLIDAMDVQVENELMQIWNDPDSEIGFDMRWSQLSQREKNRLLVRVERGNLDEMERIIRAMLLSESVCRDLLSRHEKGLEAVLE